MAIIEFEGKKYQCVKEDPQRRCNGCEFDDAEFCTKPDFMQFPDCYGDHIIFQEVKEDLNSI